MSDVKMPDRWAIGPYDGYMVPLEGGDYVEAKDVEPLIAEIERLRARVAVLETALRYYADEQFNGYNGNGDCARAALTP
jgi:hypothetical protein